MAITLDDLGITREELTQRVVDGLVESFSTEPTWDEHGNESRRTSTLPAKVTETVKKAIETKVDTLAAEHITPRVNELIENFTMQKTNTWGEKTGEKYTFVEYLIKCAENYIREPVDLNGKSKEEADNYNWSKRTTRIAYMIDKHLHYHIEKAMQQALADANSFIVSGLKDAVKIKIDELAKTFSAHVTKTGK